MTQYRIRSGARVWYYQAKSGQLEGAGTVYHAVGPEHTIKDVVYDEEDRCRTDDSKPYEEGDCWWFLLPDNDRGYRYMMVKIVDVEILVDIETRDVVDAEEITVFPGQFKFRGKLA